MLESGINAVIPVLQIRKFIDKYAYTIFKKRKEEVIRSFALKKISKQQFQSDKQKPKPAI